MLSLLGAAPFKDLTAGELQLEVKRAWTVVANPQLLLELRAGKGGDRGVLQVSRMSTASLQTLTDNEDLGAVAAKFGESMTARGKNWGKSAGSKKEPSALGRMGMSSFVGGQYPSIVAWFTVTRRAAYMWTWLGPDPQGSEVDDMVKLVMTAKELPAKK